MIKVTGVAIGDMRAGLHALLLLVALFSLLALEGPSVFANQCVTLGRPAFKSSSSQINVSH